MARSKQRYRLNLNLVTLAPVICGLVQLHLEAFILDVLPSVAEAAQANQMLGLELTAASQTIKTVTFAIW